MDILEAKLDGNCASDINKNRSSGFDMGHEAFDEDQILAALIRKKRSKKVKNDAKLRNRKHMKFKSYVVKHRGDPMATRGS